MNVHYKDYLRQWRLWLSFLIDDKTSSKEPAYDMIMGMDLMKSIGITVDCEKICIRWGGTDI
jgi:hypothetical protein